MKTVKQRWEDGDDHDPRSMAMVSELVEIDGKHGGDSMCLKVGGDGDNGECLMFLLDIYFERRSEHCPGCGYTEEDKLTHGDHRLCIYDPNYVVAP